ncbi:MAG: phosphoribosylanthranilate isomerase [Trueperaceae bacterium]|nr:phosphoribosylanthranilate isomerase [Trueperaceae bacterium]
MISSDSVVRVKVCGLTRPEDAVAAQAAGVDAVGLMFVSHSKRLVTLAQAEAVVAELAPFVTRVGVFQNARLDEVYEAVTELRLDAVQLHGSESEQYAAELRRRVKVIRALSFSSHPNPQTYGGGAHDALMLDGQVPGSGVPFDWRAAEAWAGVPGLIVAGGLSPANVADAVRALKPFAVDVSTGVESAPGVKSATLMRAFMAAVRSA